MLRSPLKWVGGKYKLRDVIVGKFPAHELYVELFCGAAWVLFGKPPETSKSEVLNDLDGELVNFWRVVKHRPAEFTEAASWLLASRELFKQWNCLSGIGGEVERAVRFFAVMRTAFGAKRVGNHFGVQYANRPNLTWPQAKEEVQSIIRRLSIVWVERMPWDQCIEKFNRSEAFFYADPPYRLPATKSYRHGFTDEDHARLADILQQSVKGKWLLSYNDDPFLRSLYRSRNVTVETVAIHYSVQAKGKPRSASELLIRNY